VAHKRDLITGHRCHTWGRSHTVTVTGSHKGSWKRI